ncbi:hypothetical protein ABIB40_003875 [Pedobacter sp. UYP30]|uniref:hypothetical protein n=1 Tax=Pedobacter sp. UYP30 TaxID=1756400 RepID=UPI00339415DD
MKILSGILIMITVFFSVKHGWAGLTNKVSPEQSKMFADLGINRPLGFIIGALTLAVALLVLFPKTFFVGNLLNATLILFIMALALNTDNLKLTLIEIPFLLMPLLLIYLGHPFKN